MWTNLLAETGLIEFYRKHVCGGQPREFRRRGLWGTTQRTPGGEDQQRRGGPPPPPAELGPTVSETAGVGEVMVGERRDDARRRHQEDLPHWRVEHGGVDVGLGLGSRPQASTPDVGEAETSAVYFLVHAPKKTGAIALLKEKCFFLASADTGVWMPVLLGMSCWRIVPHGEGEVELTVRQVSGGWEYSSIHTLI